MRGEDGTVPYVPDPNELAFVLRLITRPDRVQAFEAMLQSRLLLRDLDTAMPLVAGTLAAAGEALFGYKYARNLAGAKPVLADDEAIDRIGAALIIAAQDGSTTRGSRGHPQAADIPTQRQP